MKPSTEQDLAEAVKSASGPLRISGGGTRPIGNPVAGQALSTSAISGIKMYEPGALTIVVKAGTPMAEIEAALAKEKQRLPFEPMDHRGLLGTSGAPTIGGVAACNVSGPRRIQAGACRDFMLGVRFVDGSGHILKNGGRVMKNVTGYDLVKLMAGSFGTLGVITEVSLKVLPQADTQATLQVHGLEDDIAVSCMSAALGSPFEVSGAVFDPSEKLVNLRIEGFEKSVAYRLDQLKNLLGHFGEITVQEDPAKCADLWQAIRDVSLFSGTAGDVWRVSVKPTDGPDVVSKAAAESALYDWGGGLVWLRMAEGTDLRKRLGAFSGTATLVRGSDAMRARAEVFQPEPDAIAQLTKGLRDKFDPRGILNPGLMA